MAIKEARRSPKPPKLVTLAAPTRPIDRLAPADRDRIRANAAAFLAWIRCKKEIKKVLADVEYAE